MLLLALSYLGGILTILSPCILPVIPFVFAKADQPFRRSGLPLLLGMAATFALLSSVAVIGGAWVVQASNWGRALALVLMTAFGLSLIFPQFFERFFEPFTRLGSRLTQSSKEKSNFVRSFILGVATGLLWAPCAGPILGLILTGAATQGSSTKALWFLLSYALGAATSLALTLVAGGRFLGTLKKSLKVERRVKAVLGAAILAGVFAISLNLDRTLLTQISKVQTEDWENSLIEMFSEKKAAPSMTEERQLPISLSGATQWMNSPALSFEALKGKVVLVDFWTYSCINCLRTLPYVKAWAEKYKSQGLVVIGVHTPEFAFEKDPANVSKALKDLGITYPVALDNDYEVWNTFENRYWPAHYFIDRTGKIRHHHFGEGGYAQSEEIIRELLGIKGLENQASAVSAQGVQAAAQMNEVQSPETYLGYARTKNLRIAPSLKEDRPEYYKAAGDLALNEWTLSGKWQFNEENAQLMGPTGKIIFRFHARDLHLVLGPTKEGVKVHFRVRLDGHEPGLNHGLDINEQGVGMVDEHRLYQLIRQQNGSEIQDHLFEIEFEDSGVSAFAFTFG